MKTLEEALRECPYLELTHIPSSQFEPRSADKCAVNWLRANGVVMVGEVEKVIKRHDEVLLRDNRFEIHDELLDIRDDIRALAGGKGGDADNGPKLRTQDGCRGTDVTKGEGSGSSTAANVPAGTGSRREPDPVDESRQVGDDGSTPSCQPSPTETIG